VSQFYELTAPAVSPLSVADAKTYLKVTTTADDTLITSLVDVVTQYGEKYTGREFRANAWKLTIDDFADRIEICKNPVASITSIKYTVSGVLTDILSSVYYLKKTTQAALILLKENQSWPEDLDDIEAGIEIVFVTAAYSLASSQISHALKRHLSYLYMNRGDCDIKDAGKKSGAHDIYDQFRISRV